MSRPSLSELFVTHGCDKGTAPAEPWMFRGLDYGKVYDPLFAPLRDEPITLLELGWGEWSPERKDHADPDNGGRSARAWRDFFTRAQIHSVDIEKKNNTVEGVTLWQGSQADPDFLSAVHDQTGDFDIIIDDASHVSSLTIASFQILWPWLKPGGLYVVEDLGLAAYHDWYHGPTEADENPDTTVLTTMQFLKRLADEAQYRGVRSHGPWREDDGEFGWDSYPRRYFQGYWIEWIQFSYNLCVIKKGQPPIKD